MFGTVGALMRFSLDRIAQLWPPERRRRERAAARAARREQHDLALSMLVARSRLQQVVTRAGETLGRPLTLEELAAMDGAVAAARLSPDRRVEMVVGAAAQWGYAFHEYVNGAAQVLPDFYQEAALGLSEVLRTWATGSLATNRADEPQARARCLLQIARQHPELARIAAESVFALPPGHEVRDEGAVLVMLQTCLTRSLDLAAADWTDELNVQRHASGVRIALAGLVEHDLVPEARMSESLQIGQRLVDSLGPDDEDAAPFVKASVSHWLRRAEAARSGGEASLAAECDAKARAAMVWLIDGTKNPVAKFLAQKTLDGSTLSASEVERVISGGPAEAAQANPDGVSNEARQLSVRGFTTRLFEAGQYDAVPALVEPLLPTLEDAYLSAVLEQQVAQAGAALAEALGQLTMARLKNGDASGAFDALDSAKSLRFRHQSQLRRSPLGALLRDLEAEIRAASINLLARGESADVATSPAQHLDRLLETHRQAREKAGVAGVDRPGVRDVAEVLASDEAVIVLGDLPGGLLAAVVCRGDTDAPTRVELLAAADSVAGAAVQLDGRMIDKPVIERARRIVQRAF